MILKSLDSLPNKAEFFVLFKDKSMSGWGLSKGKINIVVFPCLNYSEAKQVESYANNRNDYEKVEILSRLKLLDMGLNTSRYYYRMYNIREAKVWYEGSEERNTGNLEQS